MWTHSRALFRTDPIDSLTSTENCVERNYCRLQSSCKQNKRILEKQWFPLHTHGALAPSRTSEKLESKWETWAQLIAQQTKQLRAGLLIVEDVKHNWTKKRKKSNSEEMSEPVSWGCRWENCRRDETKQLIKRQHSRRHNGQSRRCGNGREDCIRSQRDLCRNISKDKQESMPLRVWNFWVMLAWRSSSSAVFGSFRKLVLWSETFFLEISC